MKKITLSGVIKDGSKLGLGNFLSLLGAYVLYILTIWVPYINVGTTIAIFNIPLELSKGNKIKPQFIFESRFRRYMPEFFTLIGIQGVAQLLAYCFLFVPGVILSLAWSQSIYLLFDKKLSPTESMVKSNEITYGYKGTLFMVNVCIYLVIGVLSFLFGLIDETVGGVMNIVLFSLSVPVIIGCEAVAYKGLTDPDFEEIEGAAEAAETVEATEEVKE